MDPTIVNGSLAVLGLVAGGVSAGATYLTDGWIRERYGREAMWVARVASLLAGGASAYYLGRAGVAAAGPAILDQVMLHGQTVAAAAQHVFEASPAIHVASAFLNDAFGGGEPIQETQHVLALASEVGFGGVLTGYAGGLIAGFFGHR